MNYVLQHMEAFEIKVGLFMCLQMDPLFIYPNLTDFRRDSPCTMHVNAKIQPITEVQVLFVLSRCVLVAVLVSAPLTNMR